jgi:hypothetical protein
MGGLENCTIDLLGLIDGRGFPKDLPYRLTKRFGNKAANLVRRNPYLLLSERGCGFLRTDAMYLDLGLNADKLKRQTVCLLHAIQSDSNGHIWYPQGFAIDALKTQMSSTSIRCGEAIELGHRAGVIAQAVDQHGPWVADSQDAKAERQVNSYLQQASSGVSRWPLLTAGNSRLTPHQIEAFTRATRTRTGILFGPPGCLHGDTPILDPIDGSLHTVRKREEVGKPFHVFAIDKNDEIIVAEAEPPWKYPQADMIRFAFESGKEIVVTQGHRFWNGCDFVSALTLKRQLLFSPVLLPTISERDLSTLQRDVFRSTQIIQDCSDRYFVDFRRCDAQLPQDQEYDQFFSPLRDGVLPRFCVAWHSDDRVCRHTSIPQLVVVPLAKNHCELQSELQIANESESFAIQEFREQLLALHVTGEQQIEWKTPVDTNLRLAAFVRQANAIASSPFFSFCFSIEDVTRGSFEPLSSQGYAFERSARCLSQIDILQIADQDQLSGQAFCSSYCSRPSADYTKMERVVKAESVGVEHYYDFRVPLYGNYFACGCFHHNTGKTFTGSGGLKVLKSKYPAHEIAVCAPTGKAAVRITEAMEQYDVGLRATTIHRLLETRPGDHGGWRFERNRSNPLREKFIVVDESSMIDSWLMSCLLAACGPETCILFLGDVNQLPPVGRGAPLRDMIAAGLPHGELREIQRNAGTIVRACSAIKDGQSWAPDVKIDLEAESPANLGLLDAPTNLYARQRLVNAVVASAGFCDPVWDAQVIVAVNEKSPLSRTSLNPILQDELNGESEIVENTPFRENDKIICLKNTVLKGDSGGHHFIANGDIGRVVAAEPSKTLALFTDRQVVVPRIKTRIPGHAGCDLSLAYAVTCHKFQGSEIPYAFVCLDDSPGAKMICSREWLYTGISRAQKATLFVGRLETAYQMCLKQAIHERKTFLKESIQQWHQVTGVAPRCL